MIVIARYHTVRYGIRCLWKSLLHSSFPLFITGTSLYYDVNKATYTFIPERASSLFFELRRGDALDHLNNAISFLLALISEMTQ